MKKTFIVIPLATALACSSALADINMSSGAANIQFYGTLDAAVGQVQHSLSTNPQFQATVNPVSPTKTSVPSSVTGLFNGGISDSRVGIKGDYDLGAGTKAFFTLEEGFNVTTGQINDAASAMASNSIKPTTASGNGSLNGQFANRQGFVGLSNDQYGSLAVGRNYAPIYDVTLKYDPVQNAQLFSPLGFSGTYGGGGGVSEDTRVDNSLKYAKKIGAFNVGGLYKLGGTSGSKSANSAYAFNVGYEEGRFGAQAAYQVFKNAVAGFVTAGAANSTFAAPGGYSPIGAASAQVVLPNSVGIKVQDTAAFMLAVKYALTQQANVKLGYESYTLSAPTNPSAASTVPSYYGQNVGAAFYMTGAQQKTNLVFAGGDYNFTDKLNLAVGYYDISQPRSSDGKLKSSDIRFASSLLDYHASKSFDVYAGYMRGMYHGANNYTGVFNDNNVKAIGMRYKF